MTKIRNPYHMTRKRKAALAFLASRGITDPKPLYLLAYRPGSDHAEVCRCSHCRTADATPRIVRAAS